VRPRAPAARSSSCARTRSASSSRRNRSRGFMSFKKIIGNTASKLTPGPLSKDWRGGRGVRLKVPESAATISAHFPVGTRDKRRALPQGTLCANRAAVGLHDGFGDGQPQSRLSCVLLTGGVNAIERSKMRGTASGAMPARYPARSGVVSNLRTWP
jgi:hypothetical protein